MIIIDMEIPEYCAQCPMMVVHKGEDFFPTFLCKLKWEQLDSEKITKKRALHCPMKELICCRDCKYKDNTYKCRLDRDLEEYGAHRTDAYDDWYCYDGKRE